MEEHIEFAFTNPNCEEFLLYFKNKDKKIYDNYILIYNK